MAGAGRRPGARQLARWIGSWLAGVAVAAVVPLLAGVPVAEVAVSWWVPLGVAAIMGPVIVATPPYGE